MAGSNGVQPPPQPAKTSWGWWILGIAVAGGLGYLGYQKIKTAEEQRELEMRRMRRMLEEGVSGGRRRGRR